MKHTRARAALLAFLLVATAACARGSDGNATPDSTTTTEGSGSADGATALANGGFGDLESVCQDGDASGATANGVTDTEIHVGTMTDKGFAGAQGLNKEMYDSAVAFTEWCNEHGGILGRQLVLDDLDVALTEYEPRVTEACESDFALVGGGAVFDDDPNGVRVACGLPNIAGFVVTEAARNAELQVQPLPNPSTKISFGRYQSAKRDFPDGIEHYGIMSANLPAVTLVRDQLVEAAESIGYKVDYSVNYAPQGETGWANFVADMKAKDIKILEYVGQPTDLLQLNAAMETASWHPDVVLLSTNFYDTSYGDQGKDISGTIYIQSAFYPNEMADTNKATQDFLDLMEQYNPDGKVAQLGAEGVSAWLLFAQAATECGSELTASCLIDKAGAATEWTGGGLHAPQTPGNTEPTSCYLIMSLSPDGFAYNEGATTPTDGEDPFNCDPENVTTLSGS